MVGHDLQRGLDALRRALAEILEPPVQTVPAHPQGADPARFAPWLLTQTSESAEKTTAPASALGGP